MSTEEQAKAIAAAEAAVRENPAEFSLYVELGMAYFHTGRFDEALAAFGQAILLNPGAAEAYNGIGRVHYHTGPAQAAVEAYERTIELDPHSIDPYYGLGILYSAKLGDYDAAVEAFRRGLKHNPGDAFLVASLGSTYARKGEFDEAISHLEQAIRLQPGQAFAYSWLSIIYLHLKRYDDAAAACLRELEIEENNDARRVLGYVYSLLGRDEEPIAELERAITLEPEDYEARGALARLYRTIGRGQEASEQAVIAREMADRDDEYGRASLAAVSGSVEQALTLLKVALDKEQVQPGWVRIDPEFAFINEDARFKALIGG